MVACAPSPTRSAAFPSPEGRGSLERPRDQTADPLPGEREVERVRCYVSLSRRERVFFRTTLRALQLNPLWGEAAARALPVLRRISTSMCKWRRSG